MVQSTQTFDDKSGLVVDVGGVLVDGRRVVAGVGGGAVIEGGEVPVVDGGCKVETVILLGTSQTK